MPEEKLQFELLRQAIIRLQNQVGNLSLRLARYEAQRSRQFRQLMSPQFQPPSAPEFLLDIPDRKTEQLPALPPEQLQH